MRIRGTDFSGLSGEILTRGHTLRFQALGSSMIPIIWGGQVIEVAPAPVEVLREGDVIFYRRGGETLVAHRLMGKSMVQGRMMLAAKGDCHPASATEQVSPEQVLGRVVSVEWRPGWTLRLDSGPGRLLGRLLAYISPFLLLAYKLARPGAEGLGRFFSFLTPH